MRTSFHHQPEAQHPKSSAIHKLAGRLPHLWSAFAHSRRTSPEVRHVPLVVVTSNNCHAKGYLQAHFLVALGSSKYHHRCDAGLPLEGE